MDLKYKIENFYKNRFIQNTAILQGGTILQNFVQGIVGIFIARILQPELFGVYTIAFSLAGLLSIFIGVGPHDAVIAIAGETYVKKDKKETNNILFYLVKISVIAGIFALAMAVVAPWIAQYFYGSFKIGVYAAVVIVASTISTLFFSFSTLALQIAGKIKEMTILTFVQQSTRNGLALLFVFLGFGVLGAASGHLIGAVIIFFISTIMWRWISKIDDLIPSVRELFIGFKKISIRKYLGFSIWVSLDKNIAKLYFLLPILIIGLFVTASEVTYFKLAFAYINLSLSLLAPISILLNVEFPKIKVLSREKLASSFKKITLYSVCLSFLITTVAVLISPFAFKFLYGESFTEGIKYIFGLFIYGSLMGLGVGLGPMWRAINKVKVSIIINIVTLGVGLPVGLFLIRSFNLWGSVVMVTIWFTMSHIISFIYILRNLRKMTYVNK